MALLPSAGGAGDDGWSSSLRSGSRSAREGRARDEHRRLTSGPAGKDGPPTVPIDAPLTTGEAAIAARGHATSPFTGQTRARNDRHASHLLSRHRHGGIRRRSPAGPSARCLTACKGGRARADNADCASAAASSRADDGIASGSAAPMVTVAWDLRALLPRSASRRLWRQGWRARAGSHGDTPATSVIEPDARARSTAVGLGLRSTSLLMTQRCAAATSAGEIRHFARPCNRRYPAFPGNGKDTLCHPSCCIEGAPEARPGHLAGARISA